MFRLLIVDDEDSALEGLANYVDWESLGFCVAGTAQTIGGAMGFLAGSPADALLTDIHLEEESGLDLIREVGRAYPDVRCVILSGYGEFEYARQALQYGVADFLMKPVRFDVLRQTFRKLGETLLADRRTRAEQEEYRQMRRAALPQAAPGQPENPADAPPRAAGTISQIQAYICQHYAENITLQKLASQFYLHPTYLSRLFKEKTGGNFTQYLTAERVAQAKRLLRESELKVYNIGQAVGYQTPKYFSRIFREATGMSPREYREANVDELIEGRNM